MPQYQTTPFKASPNLLVSGTPSYLYGSLDDKSSPTFGSVISSSAVTTTGTLTFQVLSGNLPLQGDLITVVGTNRSVNMNVTNATILTVSTADNGASGIVTVTYAITSSTLATGADAGQVSVPRIEIGEALANGSSVPVAVPSINSLTQQGRTITGTVTFNTLSGSAAATVVLQGANRDVDSEYQTLPNNVAAANLAGNTVVVTSGAVAPVGTTQIVVGDESAAFRFYRFHTSGVSGTGNIVAKIQA